MSDSTEKRIPKSVRKRQSLQRKKDRKIKRNNIKQYVRDELIILELVENDYALEFTFLE